MLKAGWVWARLRVWTSFPNLGGCDFWRCNRWLGAAAISQPGLQMQVVQAGQQMAVARSRLDLTALSRSHVERIPFRDWGGAETAAQWYGCDSEAVHARVDAMGRMQCRSNMSLPGVCVQAAGT